MTVPGFFRPPQCWVRLHWLWPCSAQTRVVAQPAAKAAYAPFEGRKTDWHGYDRYDFFLDEESMAIKPAGPAAEKGQRRCIVVVPKAPAAGNPWSWRGCYWDHEPQAEIELLKRGFHVAYISADAGLQTGQEMGRLVCLPHGEARAVGEAGLHRHEPRRRICLHLVHATSRQGLLHLCR